MKIKINSLDETKRLAKILASKVKVGDVIEIGFGERKVKAKVTEINEYAKKDQAPSMYEIIE